MPHTREVRFFRSGRNQALRIPVEFEFLGDTALMHREGNRLVIEPIRIEPIRKPGLVELLDSLEPLDEDFPDFDTGLLPAKKSPEHPK